MRGEDSTVKYSGIFRDDGPRSYAGGGMVGIKPGDVVDLV